MKGCEELFIKKLEPFILCDKIKNQQLSKENISKIKIIIFYHKFLLIWTFTQLIKKKSKIFALQTI